jgi:uncharacterized protein YprB with RNaseH-like and TPR domain
MDLRAKLGRLRTGSALAALTALAPNFEPASMATVEPAKAERIARLRALIGEVYERDRLRASKVVALAPEPRAAPWPSVETAHGLLHVVERWLEPDHHHGRAPLAAGLRTRPGTLAVLTRDAALDELDVSRALYLDTETTGLAGGTGTVAFLVGLARFEDGVLGIEQLLVPNLGAEAPVLARLAERLAAASCVITYNGKSFDWPLLRTRFVLSRLPVPALPPHIDLLHTARSVWKQRFATLRLTEVEREVLSFAREHDVAGEEIPARYFAYLRDGRTERLAPVLEHNQNDLIALAALLGALITRLEQVDTQGNPHDALAFGRLALRIRDNQRALACARAALAASHEPAVSCRALVFASEVWRQLGDVAQAAQSLEAALPLAVDLPLRAALHFALAKLYEHDLDQLAAALQHAHYTEPVEGPLTHGRRIGRLHRKLLRRDTPQLRSARS